MVVQSAFIVLFWIFVPHLFLGWTVGELAAQQKNLGQKNFEPVPYEKDEFPLFVQDLRRFEVVLIGAIPITLLFGSLIYDIIYSVSDPNIHELTTPTENEHLFGKIGMSISISGLLAVLDMAIHLSHRNKARKERERILRNSEFIGNSETRNSGAENSGTGESSNAKNQTKRNDPKTKPKTRAKQ